MVTLILAILFAGGIFSAAYWPGDFGMGWSIFCGLLGFGVFQGVVGYFLQKKVKADMQSVQTILMRGQQQLQQKMARWQIRPPGSMQQAQDEMMRDTKVFVKEALEQTTVLRKYKLWVPMIERQIATAQLQLNWMVKDFKEVDRLLPKTIAIDPQMIAIKIARLYMTNGDLKAMEKLYKKGTARARYNQNVLLAAEWSWIQVQKGDADGAFKTLTQALKNSDNETLKRNHEVLMNNRVAHFTNSGLGDQWYALLLEEPRARAPRQHPVYR